MTWAEDCYIEEFIQENNMFGYIFEVTNKKTGEKYLGKRYAVTFDKNYFGEEENEALAVAIEKNGRPSFEVKMLMPYDSPEAIDAAFAEMKPIEKPKKKIVKEEPESEPAEEKKPARKKSTKRTEDK